MRYFIEMVDAVSRAVRARRWAFATAVVLAAQGAARAQTMGFYALVPIIHDKPYVAEKMWRSTSILSDGTQRVDEFHTVVMRDKEGRLREETRATPPDARGAFRKATVRILDPITMQQTDLDLAATTFVKFPIPPEAKNSRQGGVLDCARQVAAQKDSEARGQVAVAQFEDLGEKEMFGISAHGCRIRRKFETQELWSETEIWSSAELQINLVNVTRYGNGREDLQQVESLRRDEPDAALFTVPEEYRDMRTPPPRTNMNPNLDLLAESGAVTWHDGIATLTAAGPYPMQNVADTLGQCLGIALGTERPLEVYFASDMLDVSDPKWAAEHPNMQHPFVSKPAKVSVDFQLNAAGNPADVTGMLKEVARQVNEQQPYGFEVRTLQRKTGTGYVMVPTSTHDATGQLIHPQQFLDTPVTIKPQTAKIMDFGSMVAAQVTQATGFHFDCCQSFVAGQLWGMQQIPYEAVQKPAREVMADLMEAVGQVPRYMSACEPGSNRFCMINVEGTGALPGQTAGRTCRIPGYDPGR